VPHLLQKSEPSGISFPHFGHFILGILLYY
jgi:hypothetical protein